MENFVRAIIAAPNEGKVHAAYNKIFALFPKGTTSMEEYEVEIGDTTVYVVDMYYNAVTLIDAINEINFVSAELITIPEEVQAVLGSFEDETYSECARIEKELNAHGWEIDWYLDASPYYLRPSSTKDLVDSK